jgi:Methyltransferase domain/Glycosyltransferase family 9 (heptosyltransferase)
MLDNLICFHWNHGLGDTANLCRVMQVYRRRGFVFEIDAPPDKAELLQLAGAVRARDSGPRHEWLYPHVDTDWDPARQWARGWAGNKVGCNLNRPPLPVVGDDDELWRELCEPCDLAGRVPAAICDKVRRFLERLPRPVVLFHGTGNSGRERKSLPFAFQSRFYRELLDRMEGTLVTLDWDDRIPRLANFRVRHLDSFGPCSAVELLALIDAADLMIGVDSGPLHVASLTSTPTVGVWQPGHYPSTYSVPRAEQLNLVLRSHTRRWNAVKRIPWNIVDCPGPRFDPARTAELCAGMLRLPRYLPPMSPFAPRKGALQTLPKFRPRDIQLQQFVREFCRGGANPGGLSGYCDRNNTFDALLRESSRRFPESPLFVETGCIRAEEDWAGAGFATYLFGAYLQPLGGTLHSVDVDPEHCRFAREWTAVFEPAVQVHCSRGDDWLRRFAGPIDVLFLDSADTDVPGHDEVCLAELRAALPKLHERSLVLIDDTPFDGGWSGKGRRAVPWALENGWRILTAGYQVLLCRTPPQAMCSRFRQTRNQLAKGKGTTT